MAISRTLIGLALGISLVAFANQVRAQENGAEVVAEVGGHKVTRAELEEKQAAKLLEARYQSYLVERQALDLLIEDHLLQMEARRENLSVEQLLNREVTGKVKDPTEDQLEVFYEGLRSNESYATVREKILATLRQLRLEKARAAYLQTLRGRASVHIALAPPQAEVVFGNPPRRGPQDAPVLIVEFADYECPYCQRIYPELKKLQEEFAGKVAVAFKDFPLPTHPHAKKVAEAARCAAEQGRFWEFHDLLFDGRQKLDLPQLKEYARVLKLDAARFDQCLDAGKQAASVQKDFAQGQHLGLTGTPSFFINGHFLSGAVKYDTLREVVEQQLAASRQQPPVATGSARSVQQADRCYSRTLKGLW